MISCVIAHVPKTPALETMLSNCLASLTHYDELILVINDGIGYGAAFNRGFKHARGDYIIAVSNDTVLKAGKLEDLCDPEAVTYSADAQWGCFFCLPRWIYEKVGGFDETFGKAYYEDLDYLKRLERWGIPVKRVESVKVEHVGGATVKALDIESESAAIGRQRYVEKYGEEP